MRIALLAALVLAGCTNTAAPMPAHAPCVATQLEEGAVVECVDGTWAFIPRMPDGSLKDFGCFWPNPMIRACQSYGVGCKETCRRYEIGCTR